VGGGVQRLELAEEHLFKFEIPILLIAIGNRDPEWVVTLSLSKGEGMENSNSVGQSELVED